MCVCPNEYLVTRYITRYISLAHPRAQRQPNSTLFTETRGGNCHGGGWCFHFELLASGEFTSSAPQLPPSDLEDSYKKCLAVQKLSSSFETDLEAHQVCTFQKSHCIQWSVIQTLTLLGFPPLESVREDRSLGASVRFLAMLFVRAMGICSGFEICTLKVAFGKQIIPCELSHSQHHKTILFIQVENPH